MINPLVSGINTWFSYCMYVFSHISFRYKSDARGIVDQLSSHSGYYIVVWFTKYMHAHTNVVS